MMNCKHCVDKSRRFCVWCFLSTVTFPMEHVLWTKAPILSNFTRMMGL